MMKPMTSALLTLVVAFAGSSCGDDDAAADPARFCEINTEIDALDDLTEASPEEARDLVAQSRDLLSEAEGVAPDEISAEVQVTLDAFRQILDYYEDADFDVDPAELDAAAESSDIDVFWDLPEFEVMFGWVDQNCAS